MRLHYKIVFTFGGTAFLLLAGLVSAQTPPAKTPAKSTAQTGAKPAAAKPAPLEVPQLKFEKYKLENGLEVILSEDHRLPMVAFNLWYNVGPANELPGRTGFAHLFEHMMFEGSRHVPGNAHFHFLKLRERAISMAPPISTAPTTTKLFHRTSWRWRSGWNRTAWGICPTSWIRPTFPTNRTLCATSVVKAWKTRLMESWKRECSICSIPRATRITATSWVRMRTSNPQSWKM